MNEELADKISNLFNSVEPGSLRGVETHIVEIALAAYNLGYRHGGALTKRLASMQSPEERLRENLKAYQKMAG